MLRFLIFFLFIIFSVNTEQEPNPYEQLDRLLPSREFGWFSGSHQMFIKTLIESRKVEVIVELGSSLGQSTIFMAKQIPKGGKVFAVSTWSGSPEFHFAYSSFIPTLYQQFLSNVIHEQLQATIIPIKSELLKAIKRVDLPPDLIYFSALYDEYSVYSNLCAWFPVLKENGIICGDGWGWGSRKNKTGTVGRAVLKFSKEYNVKFYTNNWLWVVYK